MALASVNWGFPEPFVCAHPSPVWEPLTDIVFASGHASRAVVGYRCGRCRTYIPKDAADARREEEVGGLVPDVLV